MSRHLPSLLRTYRNGFLGDLIYETMPLDVLADHIWSMKGPDPCVAFYRPLSEAEQRTQTEENERYDVAKQVKLDADHLAKIDVAKRTVERLHDMSVMTLGCEPEIEQVTVLGSMIRVTLKGDGRCTSYTVNIRVWNDAQEMIAITDRIK